MTAMGSTPCPKPGRYGAREELTPGQLADPGLVRDAVGRALCDFRRHVPQSAIRPTVEVRVSGVIPDATYAVIRAGEGVHPSHIGDLEGRWVDLPGKSLIWSDDPDRVAPADGMRSAVLTDRYEMREDGAVAQVYEVRP